MPINNFQSWFSVFRVFDDNKTKRIHLTEKPVRVIPCQFEPDLRAAFERVVESRRQDNLAALQG